MNQILYNKISLGEEINDPIKSYKGIKRKIVQKFNIQNCLYIILAFMLIFSIVSINYATETSTEQMENVDSYIENNNITVQDKENEEVNMIIENDIDTIESISNVQMDNIAQQETYSSSSGEQYNIIATLNIPSLNIEYPILSSTSTELLKISLTKYWGANPNEVGNMVVVGHNYKNTKFFSKLSNIKKGAIIKITDKTGETLNYSVYDTYVIDPYNNDCTSQLTNGKTEITLITCYNNGTQRFVVKARTN